MSVDPHLRVLRRVQARRVQARRVQARRVQVPRPIPMRISPRRWVPARRRLLRPPRSLRRLRRSRVQILPSSTSASSICLRL
jgi:hypothetical protein